MTDQVKALIGAIAVGIVQFLFVVYAHLAGWTEGSISSILLIGFGLYMAIIVWIVQRVRGRSRKKHSSVNSN
jgi:ABC-type nickel/cobalt efflux system permease component RcnA